MTIVRTHLQRRRYAFFDLPKKVQESRTANPFVRPPARKPSTAAGGHLRAKNNRFDFSSFSD
jgi:hypothetical protein